MCTDLLGFIFNFLPSHLSLKSFKFDSKSVQSLAQKISFKRHVLSAYCLGLELIVTIERSFTLTLKISAEALILTSELVLLL
jgi:hypothetical protein